MTTATARLGLTMATYGEGPGGWGTWWNDNCNELEARLSSIFAGNPNGNVAGYWEGQRCTDQTNNKLYICSATGNAASASWTEIGSYAGFVGSINALTAATSPAIDDLLAMWDLSASGNRAITFKNYLRVVEQLTALTASDTDLTNDKIFLWDDSADEMKYGSPQNFSGIDPIAYSARALSATMAVTLATVVTFTHGLGAKAKDASAWYVNLSTQGGYVAGDKIKANAYNDAGIRGIQLIIDNDTQVKAAIAAIAPVWPTKDASSSFTLTATDWAVVIEAWT